MDVSDKFKGMMENESDEVDDDELDNFSDAFVCCICRDLLYKPVVLEEEKDTGYFSPQINVPDHKLQPQETIINSFDASETCFSVRALETMPAVLSDPVRTETGLKNSLDQRKDAAATSFTTAADRDSNQIHSNGTCKQAHQKLVREVFTFHFHQERILYIGGMSAQGSILVSVVILVGCKDCLEQIGYDLCKDCYTTSSKLPGRFNQQHTSDHQFEIVRSSAMHNIMLRLLRPQSQEVSAVSDALNDGSENVIPSSENTNDDGENVVDAPLPSSETEPNQRDNEQSA
ncbi:E3 ubiquitin-protein ligase prt1 [Phtheirospermum japonicum]|uniref:E3 ubiquitin-protein ligase prt1 n=1 Tax=Phtheirospermum japonicum TaxID=374723 RepID=A0A830CJ03_9LAMI|nr:E3 ubiquitin-protein ligase prt1 [Phtheirospermum japonicum]